MSNDLVTIHTSAKFYYHSHPPFTLPNKNIRSSSFRETNIVNPCYSYSSSGSQSEGMVEPQLNGFCTTISTSPKVGVEFESNCSCIAVNKAKMGHLQTLCTFKVRRVRESYSAPDGIRSSKKSTIFYSKFKGTTYQSAEQEILIQRRSIWKNLDLTAKHDSLPFREGPGLGPEGTFEFDSFRLCAAVNIAKKRSQKVKMQAPAYRAFYLQKLTGQNYIAVHGKIKVFA